MAQRVWKYRTLLRNCMATIPKHFEPDRYTLDLIDNVAPEWRIEFERFIESGEAEEAFLTYLNQDTGAQAAVEEAFNRQAAQFESLAADLKKQQGAKASESASSFGRSSTSSKLAAVVDAAIHTPKEQREEVVNTSTAELAASVPLEERKVLKEVVRSLDDNLAKLTDATTHT